MLDHLTTEFLANDHRATLRNDANGLRRSRLSRLRRSTRGSAPSPHRSALSASAGRPCHGRPAPCRR